MVIAKKPLRNTELQVGFINMNVGRKKIAKGTEGQQTTNKKEETTTITFYKTTLQIICEISQVVRRT